MHIQHILLSFRPVIEMFIRWIRNIFYLGEWKSLTSFQALFSGKKLELLFLFPLICLLNLCKIYSRYLLKCSRLFHKSNADQKCTVKAFAHLFSVANSIFESNLNYRPKLRKIAWILIKTASKVDTLDCFLAQHWPQIIENWTWLQLAASCRTKLLIFHFVKQSKLLSEPNKHTLIRI